MGTRTNLDVFRFKERKLNPTSNKPYNGEGVPKQVLSFKPYLYECFFILKKIIGGKIWRKKVYIWTERLFFLMRISRKVCNLGHYITLNNLFTSNLT
jgi:hypothetical protein